MAPLAPVKVGELADAIAEAGVDLLAEPAPDRPTSLQMLRGLHEVLMRATPSDTQPPVACLEAVASIINGLPEGLTDSLPPRPRTVYRLLRIAAWPAAWQVLVENAVGVVENVFDASTATGQPRSAGRLPLVTRIEPPSVFAELPGFRDPRFGVPDHCYDISGVIRLKHQLDEVHLAGSTMTLGGWAALDVLATSPDEDVRLILTDGGTEIARPGRRVRRADLVSGRGEALARRAWAGWSASVDLDDPPLASGSWELAVEIDHHGFVARAALGRGSSRLAVAAAGADGRLGSRSVRWDATRSPWRLLVSPVPEE